MTKFKLTYFSLLLFIFSNSIFISCSNDNEIDNLENNQEMKVMNSSELRFLNKITGDLTNYKKNITGRISIENPNNHMDGFGVYITNMTSRLSNELASSSTDYTQEDFKDRIATYMLNNPMPITLPEINSLNSEFYYSLVDLTKNVFLIEDADLSIQKVILIENELSQTELLSHSEKTYLLAFSSSLKYLKNYVKEVSSENSRSCIDDNMVELSGNNLGILIDFENHPVLTPIAWAALPATIGWGILDALVVSIKNCV